MKYALAFLIALLLGPGRPCAAQEGARHSYGGIVEQLSRGGRAASVPRDNSMAARLGSQESSVPSMHPGSQTSPGVAVPMRPSGMSVRTATFETTEPISADALSGGSLSPMPNDLRRDMGVQNTESHLQSFIDREQASPTNESSRTTELVSKIGINLLFVLAIAIAAVLSIRSFQKGKVGKVASDPEGFAGLKIDQVLRVTRGVSLYLIDGPQSKVLVAIDSGGIKSVHLMPGDFADGLEEPDAFLGEMQHASPDHSSVPPTEPTSRRSARQKIDTTSSSAIDENLIRLLLQQPNKAA